MRTTDDVITIYAFGAMRHPPNKSIWAARLTQGMHTKLVSGAIECIHTNLLPVIAVVEAMRKLTVTGCTINIIVDTHPNHDCVRASLDPSKRMIDPVQHELRQLHQFHRIQLLPVEPGNLAIQELRCLIQSWKKHPERMPADAIIKETKS